VTVRSYGGSSAGAARIFARISDQPGTISSVPPVSSSYAGLISSSNTVAFVPLHVETRSVWFRNGADDSGLPAVAPSSPPRQPLRATAPAPSAEIVARLVVISSPIVDESITNL